MIDALIDFQGYLCSPTIVSYLICKDRCLRVQNPYLSTDMFLAYLQFAIIRTQYKPLWKKLTIVGLCCALLPVRMVLGSIGAGRGGSEAVQQTGWYVPGEGQLG